MQYLVDRECQIQRDLGVGDCELEGQKRKLVWFGNEERWIEHWLGSQVWLHMSGHRSWVGYAVEELLGMQGGLWSGERSVEEPPAWWWEQA